MAAKNDWVTVNIPLGPLYDYSKDEVTEKKSMNGLLKPGMLLELKNKEVILVGDINKSGGVCDDCHYGPETVVKRYKQLDIKELSK